MAKPVVSILVVTYNAERDIAATLESCLNQTYQETELLVLDNGSTDQTISIIKRMGSEKIQLFKVNKNQGPYGGLNYLLERAAGDYIAIQDHDDLWLPEKLERQVDFLERHSNYVACGTQTYYYYEARELAILTPKSGNVQFVDHTSLVFRNQGFRYDLSHTLADEYFEKKVLTQAGLLWCLAEPLVIHRIKRDGTNLSSSRFTLTKKNRDDFFVIHGLSAASLLYFCDLLLSRYLPKPFIWWIRKYVTLRHAKWISANDLQKLTHLLAIER